MAGLIGVDIQTLAAYEAGRRRIPMKQALKLCPYGIALDWIYQGQMANLHPHIRDKILEQTPNPRTRAERTTPKLGLPRSSGPVGMLV
jgi:transcriptional regulator with XRE-family HTH domain